MRHVLTVMLAALFLMSFGCAQKAPEQKAETEKKVEPEKKVEADKKAEPEKKVETDKKAEPEKKVEADKKAEPEKKDEADKKAEPTKDGQTERKATRDAPPPEAKKVGEDANATAFQEPELKPIEIPTFEYPEFSGKKVAIVHTGNLIGELEPCG